MNYFLIYIAGFIINYLILKYYAVKVCEDTWTKRDRIEALAPSVFSWLAVVISTYYFIKDYESDETASW